MKRIIFLTVLSFVVLTALQGQGQYQSKYPDIPIVDVHYQPTELSHVVNMVKVRDVIKQKYDSYLAYFICLNNVEDHDAMRKVTNNRILFSVHAGVTHLGNKNGGFDFTAEEVIEKVQNGFVGFKFWFGGPYRRLEPGQAGITRLDDPRFAPLFAKLEKANVLMTSLHNADPNGPFGNRTSWMFDPVFYWEQIRALENVLATYPKLTIVAAHGAWLVCQDAQFDYLRYMFSTYPNLYVDISATFQFMHLSNRDNIRDFYIEYQDRLLYGTDGGQVSEEGINSYADRYAKTFAILETDQVVDGGFFGNTPTKGLDLPKEVLEKIYYKNAVKLYPGLKEIMGL